MLFDYCHAPVTSKGEATAEEFLGRVLDNMQSDKKKEMETTRENETKETTKNI